jgi:hypothetical protein
VARPPSAQSGPEDVDRRGLRDRGRQESEVGGQVSKVLWWLVERVITSHPSHFGHLDQPPWYD